MVFIRQRVDESKIFDLYSSKVFIPHFKLLKEEYKSLSDEESFVVSWFDGVYLFWLQTYFAVQMVYQMSL